MKKLKEKLPIVIPWLNKSKLAVLKISKLNQKYFYIVHTIKKFPYLLESHSTDCECWSIEMIPVEMT